MLEISKCSQQTSSSHCIFNILFKTNYQHQLQMNDSNKLSNVSEAHRILTFEEGGVRGGNCLISITTMMTQHFVTLAGHHWISLFWVLSKLRLQNHTSYDGSLCPPPRGPASNKCILFSGQTDLT